MESKEKIRKFLMENKNIKELKDDDDLFKCGFVDSLFAFKLVLFLEVEFKIKIKNKDINEENFRTIQNIDETVQRLSR